MIRDSHQFGSFDGLDNRKEVMRLLAHLGDGVSFDAGCHRRQKFLQSLMEDSNTFAMKPMQVTPCDTVQAYNIFFAIVGCLGVGVDVAVRRLEVAVRNLQR